MEEEGFVNLITELNDIQESKKKLEVIPRNPNLVNYNYYHIGTKMRTRQLFNTLGHSLVQII